MSTFEHRTQLWSAARAAIDLAETDLQALSEQLATEQPGSYTSSLADFFIAFGFAVDDRGGEAEGVLHANLQRFNAEDMRKGLRHGHVAIAAVRDAAPTHDLVAGVAAAAVIRGGRPPPGLFAVATVGRPTDHDSDDCCLRRSQQKSKRDRELHYLLPISNGSTKNTRFALADRSDPVLRLRPQMTAP